MAGISQTGALFADLSSGQYRRVVVDFDNTLFLDNSTERYLDALRPRTLAFLIVACCDWALEVLAWLGLCRYNAQRDYVRVLACTLLMPWSLVLWRRATRTLAGERMNRALVEVLPDDPPAIVLSYGFRHVIRPLLDAAGLSGGTLVCSRLWPPSGNLRRSGKLAALAERLPESEWEHALFVTDSRDDAEIMEAIPRSHLIEWGAPGVPAFEGVYVPLRYTVQGKYAGSRYFTYQIVLEDFALLLLAYQFAWSHAAALWFLLLSLHTIYEIGYYENDHRAARRESKPVVSEAARTFRRHPQWTPWLWAAALGLIGLIFLQLPMDLGWWLAMLLGLYAVFWLFNRLTPRQRVGVLPVLHVFKTFSFALFVPLTVVGALLLAAQVLSVSANYALYRFTGDFSRFNRQLWRMVFFLLLALACYSLYVETVTQADYARWGLILVWGGIRSLEHARRKNILRMLAEWAGWR